MTKIPNLKEMFATGMHFGHSISRWHPKMAPFIFGKQKGIYIIDLEKSQKMLEQALFFMEKLVSESKTILFVGTKNQVKEPLKKMAKEINMPFVGEKWLGGCLTNFIVVKKTINKYKELVEKKESGKLEKYTKKERLEIIRYIEQMEAKVGGLVQLNKLPDALFVWDIKKEKTAVLEARKKNIPIIGVCDTNVNPTLINYVIPANDDATKTIKLILDTIKNAILEAQAKAKDKN